jgi:hypothetical protein
MSTKRPRPIGDEAALRCAVGGAHLDHAHARGLGLLHTEQLPASQPGLTHICARTDPHLRRD